MTAFGLVGIIATILVWLGFIVLIIGNLFMLVLIFRSGIMWLLACYLIPFAGLVWLITHWSDAKGPFAISMGGVVIIVAGILMGGSVPFGGDDTYDSTELIAESESGEEEVASEGAANEQGPLDDVARNAAAANAAMSDAPAQTPAPDAAAAAGTVPTPEPTQVAMVAPVPTPGDVLPPELAGAGAPAPASPTPPATLAATPTFAPVTPVPMYIEHAPIDTLWPRYYAAVRAIQDGEHKAVQMFHDCCTADDVMWLESNYAALADLITSGCKFADPTEAKLVVLKALVRNMPARPADVAPSVKRKQGSGIAVADVYETVEGDITRYTTALVQENGRWLIAHLFFTRDFVWGPQLAVYKAARRTPLSMDEQTFLMSGFAPFQQQVRTVFQNAGYASGG